MGTSITAADLTVTVSENLTLNGVQQGSSNKLTLSDIAEFSRRIVTVPTSEVSIVAFGDAVGAGTFHNTAVLYIRFTNLDNANYVTLNFEGANSTDFSIRLDKNRGTHIITATHATLGVDDYCDVAASTLEKLETIKATANTGTCDVEVVVASK